MDRFVPLGKKSKKEQKKDHARQRKTWEGISPVTRTVPNGKAYNRRKRKADERRSSSDFRNETLLLRCFRSAFARRSEKKVIRDFFFQT